ncbi:toxin-antitoxin system HicB family antitoxin [Blastococcus sp. CT_GayMR16]|uniref:toxin-antitoxin system HicB family antitoxin n=1 Tax=Blastococcus sp. CT_GayMR16 TaxID=2559607 RepID=UPI0010734FDE|nr:toxin-antitoxin system HicB family antitoxin [Blastococcus sp. CT_GayMR16]TFV86866.1 toxin-antitoxin system HicB family antitoxin [Blastococcus sp. CT_GayMR16]
MDLSDYVDALRGSLTTAAAAGGPQAQETARLLADTMEPAVRLALIDALSALAAEVTAALDGPLVDIRLRGRDPEVVVVPAEHDPGRHPTTGASPDPADDAADDGSTARISLRLPDGLKARAEAAAATAGSSLNTWLIRAVTAAVREPAPPPSGRGPRRYTGFARS